MKARCAGARAIRARFTRYGVEKLETKNACARRSVAAVARAQGHRLYYYGRSDVKQIGAEMGVNESPRLAAARARHRRLRDALGDMNPQKLPRCGVS